VRKVPRLETISSHILKRHSQEAKYLSRAQEELDAAPLSSPTKRQRVAAGSLVRRTV
jgi:hypothetical protein